MHWVQVPRQSNVGNLNNVRHEANRHLRHIRKLNLRNLKLTVRSKIVGTRIEASVTLRMVTSLELT